LGGFALPDTSSNEVEPATATLPCMIGNKLTEQEINNNTTNRNNAAGKKASDKSQQYALTPLACWHVRYLMGEAFGVT
jgi:hypothetical protein